MSRLTPRELGRREGAAEELKRVLALIEEELNPPGGQERYSEARPVLLRLRDKVQNA